MLIKTDYLKAMLLTAADGHIRYQINSVAIEGRFMISTDGHRMTVCNLGEDSGLNVIIPREAIEIVLKRHGKIGAIGVDATRIADSDYKPIAMQYPDWRRVIPHTIVTMDLEFTWFNGQYLADFAKMQKLLLGNNWLGLAIRQATESSCAIVDIRHPDFFCVLMPITKTANTPRIVPNIPDWLKEAAQ